MVLFLVGFFYVVFGEIVNCFCVFGMLAVIYVNWAIKIGDGDLFIVGGVEYMICGFWVILKVFKFYGRDV